MKKHLTLIKLVLFIAILSGITLSTTNSTAAAAQGARLRWDTASISEMGGRPVLQTGGPAYAQANDGSTIKFTGSGTFGPGLTDPVTGGGNWSTFDAGGGPTGSGTYTVSGLVSFEPTAGTLPDVFIDRIGTLADVRAGLAFLRIAYSDGTRGILTVSCSLVGTSPAVFEGITASKGSVDYWNRTTSFPDLDVNTTVFHVAR